MDLLLYSKDNYNGAPGPFLVPLDLLESEAELELLYDVLQRVMPRYNFRYPIRVVDCNVELNNIMSTLRADQRVHGNICPDALRPDRNIAYLRLVYTKPSLAIDEDEGF